MKRRKNTFSFIILTSVFFICSFLNGIGFSESTKVDFMYKPEHLVKINETMMGNQREFDFYVTDEQYYDYTLFIRLHNMSVSDCKGQGSESPKITIDIDGAEGDVMDICHSDFSHDDEMTGRHYYFAHHNVTISALGNWGKDDYANVYVSIFYETNDCSSCQDKDNGYCCRRCRKNNKFERQQQYFYASEDKETVVFLEEEIISRESSTPRSRCIPSKLKCNNVPSCGDVCSSDESSETCAVPGCYSYGYSMGCWSVGFVWTALLAVLFFVLAPTAIIFLICYNSQLAMLRRARLAQESRVTVHSPPNDLPPTYDEVEAPPPCFCSVIDPEMCVSTGNEDAGAINLGFEPTEAIDSPVPKSVTCQCAKQQIP